MGFFVSTLVKLRLVWESNLYFGELKQTLMFHISAFAIFLKKEKVIPNTGKSTYSS